MIVTESNFLNIEDVRTIDNWLFIFNTLLQRNRFFFLARKNEETDQKWKEKQEEIFFC